MIGKMRSAQKNGHRRLAATTHNIRRLRGQLNTTQIEFLFAELNLSTTFCEVALSTADPKRRARNIENAAKGYVTALLFLNISIQQGLEDDEGFQERLANLKALLRQLGRKV